IRRKGAAKSAADELAHLHADTREFVLHLDTDVIAPEDFSAVNVPDSSGGLSLEEIRAALSEFLRHKNLIGFDIAQYHPDRDPDGSAAKKPVDLIASALSARLLPSDTSAPTPQSATPDAVPELPKPPVEAASSAPEPAVPKESSEPSASEASSSETSA